MALDFDTLKLDGILKPTVQLLSGVTPSSLPTTLTFSTTMNSSYAFGAIASVPVTGNVDVTGRLYGPTGEELNGTFEYFGRDSQGFATSGFAGVFVTKQAP